MKRGQSEIIGLVIVVLLLVFALIFFVKIKSSDYEDESRLIRYNLRANSALNALMKVHIENDDKKRQMKDLIEEGILTNYYDDVRSNLTYYFDDTTNGGFSNDKYRLIVSVNGEDIIPLGDDCKSSISASPFYLRNNGKVELMICT